jgi:hypothetical protein
VDASFWRDKLGANGVVLSHHAGHRTPVKAPVPVDSGIRRNGRRLSLSSGRRAVSVWACGRHSLFGGAGEAGVSEVLRREDRYDAWLPGSTVGCPSRRR